MNHTTPTARIESLAIGLLLISALASTALAQGMISDDSGRVSGRASAQVTRRAPARMGWWERNMGPIWAGVSAFPGAVRDTFMDGRAADSLVGMAGDVTGRFTSDGQPATIYGHREAALGGRTVGRYTAGAMAVATGAYYAPAAAAAGTRVAATYGRTAMINGAMVTSLVANSPGAQRFIQNVPQNLGRSFVTAQQIVPRVAEHGRILNQLSTVATGPK